MVAKQQLNTQPKRQTPYNHVSSRINTVNIFNLKLPIFHKFFKLTGYH